MNCCMLTRALAVATGLVAVYFPVAGQQANQPEPTKDRAAAFEQSHAAGALDRAFALSLYQSKILGAKNSSLLFFIRRLLPPTATLLPYTTLMPHTARVK